MDCHHGLPSWIAIMDWLLVSSICCFDLKKQRGVKCQPYLGFRDVALQFAFERQTL
jgi:hypothetical protein